MSASLWVPVKERLPTVADASPRRDVLWQWPSGSIMTGKWYGYSKYGDRPPQWWMKIPPVGAGAGEPEAVPPELASLWTPADEAAFASLADTWRKETCKMSILQKRYRHPAYLAILAMGEPVIPSILRQLRDDPDFWFEALHKLTGLKYNAGSSTFKHCQENWLAWGRRQGLIEESTQS